MAETIFILLFWAGIVVIGYGVLYILSLKFPFVKPLLRPSWLGVLISFTAGFATLVPVLLLSYALHLTVGVASVVYGLLLIGGVAIVFRVKPWQQISLSKLTLSLIAIVAIDYIVFSYIGGVLTPGGDAYYHMARVKLLLHEGFTIATPFSQFATDGSYHYNVVYGVYAIAAYYTGLEPYELWRFVGACTRFMIWVSIFCLARLLVTAIALPKAADMLARRYFPFIATLGAVLAYGSNFLYATFPSLLAVLWIHVLIVGLLYALGRETKRGLIIASLAVLALPFTHPSYAFMTACLLVVVIGLGLLFRAIRRTEVVVLLVMTGALLIGPVISKIMTGPLTTGQAEIASSLYSSIGPLLVRNPETIIATPAPSFVLIIVGLAANLALLYVLRKQKRILIVIGSVTLLWWVIMFVPGVLNLLSLFVPLWLIARFDALNALQYIMPFIPLIALVYAVNNKMRSRVAMALCSALVVVATIIIGYQTVTTLHQRYDANALRYEELRKLDALLPEDDKRIDIFANDADSYSAIAVRAANVLSIGEGHMVPSSLPALRGSCQTAIWESGRPEQAAYMGADYLIDSSGVMDNKEYEKIASINSYTIYKLTSKANTVKACDRLMNGVYVQ